MSATYCAPASFTLLPFIIFLVFLLLIFSFAFSQKFGSMVHTFDDDLNEDTELEHKLALLTVLSQALLKEQCSRELRPFQAHALAVPSTDFLASLSPRRIVIFLCE